MPFTPGRTKTGGRKAGTPNRTTAELRKALKATIEAELDELPVLLNVLEPAKRVEAIIRLMPNVMPRSEAKGQDLKAPVLVFSSYAPDKPPSCLDGSPLSGE